MKEISWLHLSDLHAGMDGQSWLWPTLKHALFKDLSTLHEANGDWDFVIFSGDLTQRASTDDYGKLSEVILELWGVFRKLGFNPSIFCVPGNHDLFRPYKFQPEVMVLEDWWETSREFREEFWKSVNPYLTLVNKNFDNYKAWVLSLESNGIKLISTQDGVIAGDTSGVIEKEGLKLGLVGLNSTWLQLGGNNYKEKLHIDVAQAFSVTGGDPEKWCANNDFNLIVTHHPLDWLHRQSLSDFKELIAPDGRFTCHLFGHMHEPNHQSISTGGSKARRELQAASLFGLEKVQSSGIERIHGYSLNKISSNEGIVELSFLPRKDRLVAGGRRVVGADPYFEFEVIKETLIESRSSSPILSPTLTPLLELSELAATTEGALEAFSLKVQPSPQHRDVRRVELDNLIAALESNRCAWVISEWGMGEDGFLWALQQKDKANISQYLTLNMANFKNLPSFQEEVKSETGHSIEVLCGALEDAQGLALLLDDIPVDTHWNQEQTKDILKLAKIFLDFAPHVNVIMRARVSPKNGVYAQVELKALDQGDTRLYILDHANGGEKYSNYDSIDRIYRNTDGIPNVIDSVLKNLSVTGLSGLSAISSDVAGKEVISPTGNEALRKMIFAIGDSPDPALKLSYELLKALTIFPQGEQLQRIKYFNPRTPFFYSSVHELMSRGLISTVETETLGLDHADAENTIIVNRLVREVLIAMLNPAQFKDFNRKAATLYFGERTSQGVFKPPRSLRFDKSGRSNAEISNAAVIIQRLAIEAVSTKDKTKINYVVELASFHANALFSGSYFKAAADFFQDIFPLVSEHISDKQHAYFTAKHASALRMLDGEKYSQQARDMILSIEPDVLDKPDRLQAELNLALCHHSLKSATEAIASAEKVIFMDKRSNSAVQAQWIILQNETNNDESASKLNALLKTAEKRKIYTVLNSIKLEKANEETNPLKQKGMYEDIISQAHSNGDTYDAMRSIVALGKATKDEYTPQDKNRLIQAYHYLYKGGFLYLFNNCHDALWNIFEKERDLLNLLQLFKYSSLVWRLRGIENLELEAISKLKVYVANHAVEVSTPSRGMSYYIFRSTSE